MVRFLNKSLKMWKQRRASAKYPCNTTNCFLYREKNHKIVYSISGGKERY